LFLPRVCLAAPALRSVTPSSGIQGATIAVTLTGSGFLSGQTSLSVNRPGIQIRNVRVLDPAHVNAILIVSAEPGTYQLGVGTREGPSNTVPFEVKPSPLDAATELRVEHFVGATAVQAFETVSEEMRGLPA